MIRNQNSGVKFWIIRVGWFQQSKIIRQVSRAHLMHISFFIALIKIFQVPSRLLALDQYGCYIEIKITCMLCDLY